LRSSTLPVWIIAAAYVALQLAVSGRYGYFRDEFYYLACGDHLAWGYVDHPPMIAVVAWISRHLFGESLLAIRTLSAVAGGATIVLTGRLANLFGGDARAAALAAIAVAISPVFLFLFHILSMNAWDILLWTALAAVIARMIVEDRPQLWLSAGLLIGLGLLTKHSMAFFVAGLGAGVLLTPWRRWIISPWLWAGAVIALALVAPHLWWQVSHGWPTLEFIRNATARKNVALSPLQFVAGQLLEIHPFNAILLAAGLLFFFFADGGRFRLFGWAYVAVFLILVTQRSKTYYIAPIYPLMLAGGAAAIARASTARARWIVPALCVLLLAGGAATAPLTLPVLPVPRFLAYQRAIGIVPSSGERHEIGPLPQHYADMFGWDDIVDTVARVYRSLPPDEQSKTAIFALNYGDAGAIDLLGPKHGLQTKAISPHNNYWLWGYDDFTGEVVIVVGGNANDHLRSYTDVRRVDTIECGYCMPYENHRPVYVLRGPKRSLAEIWRSSKTYI
jgi:4-amino-4-deoxy-L-arabinose transferase-like glycosyltransferase